MTLDALKEIIEDYRFGGMTIDTVLTAVEQYSKSQNDGKPIVSSSLPLSGSQIITNAINRSREPGIGKYDGVSFKFGYIAGFEDAQSIAVGGNDR